MYNNDYLYDGYDNNNFNNRFNLKKIIIIGIVILLALITVIVVINKVKSYYSSYAFLEKQMIKEAKKYVDNHNVMILNEEYIDVSKLNISLKKNCNITSGVFVDRNYNYKAYLDCNDYQSNVLENDNSLYSLNGNEVIVLGKGTEYSEPGVKGNGEVNVLGTVGSEKGVYNLKYVIVSNNKIVATLLRKVVIVDEIYINNLYPSIILNGDKIEYIQNGSRYNEQGVSASDMLDGDLTDKVRISGKVNINVNGDYIVTYTVTNSRGYTTSITRKVSVINDFSTTLITAHLSTEETTNANVTIYLKVVGDDYQYMLLPNGQKTTNKMVEYVANDNNLYNFICFDKNGKSTTKVVEVKNINKETPNASCSANVYNDYTEVYVTPYSGSKVSSYNYNIDGIFSGERTSSNYRYNGDASNVSVVIKNSIGNSTTVKCSINDKKTTDMEVTPIPTEEFKCNTDVSNYNVQLASKVNKAGIKTREGVSAAATFLTRDLGYKIGYWWAGKYDKVGLNSEWGCSKKIWDETHTTGQFAYGTVHPYGLDCTGFIKWSFVNAGFDASLIPRSDMKYKWGDAVPKTIEFASAGNQVDNIKPGDVLWREGHAVLVVAVDDTRIKIAQAVYAGIKEDLIDKTTGKAITDTGDFTHFILLEEFYQKYGN